MKNPPKKKTVAKKVTPKEVGRKPIVVNNKNDKRLRAYNDSNELYKSSKFLKDHPLTGNYKMTEEDAKNINTNVNYFSVQKYKPKLVTTNTGYYYDYKKPVQPVVYKKPIAKPKVKPVVKSKPVTVEKKTSPPVVKKEAKQKPSPKDLKMYQGRQFMDSTGLRPNSYTEKQVREAVAKKKKEI